MPNENVGERRTQPVRITHMTIEPRTSFGSGVALPTNRPSSTG